MEVKFTAAQPEKSGAALTFLYKTAVGRAVLKLLTARRLSALVGKFLNTKASKIFIKPFVRAGNIKLDDYVLENIDSFNDFFCRRIKSDRREICTDFDALLSPCDGLLSVYKIDKGTVFPVKQSEYTVASLLKDDGLAALFDGGYAFVIRLSVNHYHRYSYAAGGKKGGNVHIDGVLHTVRPVALYNRSVFCENSREYTLIDTENFGTVLQMEVGAMLVGKILNYDGEKTVSKGDEKGRFLYGGSTVILLTQKDRVKPYDFFVNATENGLETPVLIGQRINE